MGISNDTLTKFLVGAEIVQVVLYPEEENLSHIDSCFDSVHVFFSHPANDTKGGQKVSILAVSWTEDGLEVELV